MPVMVAYQRGDAAERAFWEEALAKGDSLDADALAKAKQLMIARDAIGATMERAGEFVSAALTALEAFPDSTAKLALTQAALFAVSRTH